MNRSYSKIRHIQESNQRLENRLISEQNPKTVKYGLNEVEIEEVNEGEQTIRSKSIKDYILSQIKLFENFVGRQPDADDILGQENYNNYISGKPFKIRPEDMEEVGYDIKGRPVKKYKYREWDEIVRPEQSDRSSFTLHSYEVKYEVGDVILLKDNDVIKKVTITDVVETPYRNAGGNAFVPQTFTYKFEERKFHVPGYDTSSGRGWNDETLRAWVEENYDVELPDNLTMRPGSISIWLKDNGYERL